MISYLITKSHLGLLIVLLGLDRVTTMERILEGQNEYLVLLEMVRNRKKAHLAIRAFATTTDSNWVGARFKRAVLTVLRLGS